MATEIAGAAIKFTGNASPLQAVVKDVARSLYALDAAISKTGQAEAAKGFATAIGDTRKELAAANKEAGLLSRSLGAVGKAAMTGVGIGVGVGATMAGLRAVSGMAHRVADLGVESVQAASDAQKLAASYETLTGSADKAGKLIGELRRYAAESPLGSKAVLDVGQQLLASGIRTDQVVPTTRALGDLAAGDGVRLGRLALAYSQVISAGQLYGTELRQFSEAGIPLLDELAKSMGKPKEAMKGLVEEGRVSAADVTRAFKAMTTEGGRFSGMSERYNKTFAGSMERVKDSVDSVKRELGQRIIDDAGLTALAGRAEKAFDRAKGGLDDLRPGLKAVGEGFGLIADLAEKAGEKIGKALGHPSVTSFAQTIETGLKQFRADLAGPPPAPPPSTGDVLFNRLAQLDRTGLDAMNSSYKLARPLDPAEQKRTPLEYAKFAGQLAVMRQMVQFAQQDVEAGRRPLMPITREHFAQGAVEPYSLAALAGAVGQHGLALGAVPPLPPTAEYKPARPLALDVLGERRMLDALRPPAPPAPVYSPYTPPPPPVVKPMDDLAARLGSLAGGFAAAAQEADKLSTAFGGVVGGMSGVGMKMDQLRAPDNLPGRLVKEAAGLNQDYRNPLDAMKQKLADLDAMVGAGLIHGDTRNLAAADFVREMAGKAGLDALKPAPNAQLGTREFANMEAKAFLSTTQGDGGSPTELLNMLLQQLIEQGKIGGDQLKELRKLVDQSGKVVDNGPGG